MFLDFIVSVSTTYTVERLFIDFSFFTIPANSREIIKDMIEAGVNVFRINFSHADYNDVKERISAIRSINEEYGYTTGILADLQGPKLRVGVMEEGVIVNDGDLITFTTAEDIIGTKERVFMNERAIQSTC